MYQLSRLYNRTGANLGGCAVLSAIALHNLVPSPDSLNTAAHSDWCSDSVSTLRGARSSRVWSYHSHDSELRCRQRAITAGGS